MAEAYIVAAARTAGGRKGDASQAGIRPISPLPCWIRWWNDPVPRPTRSRT
jgi:hypothetical protein